MRVVAMADTHGRHDSVVVPEGDLLIHAGDVCNRGTIPELEAFCRWWGLLPHRHKIVIAGNHDWPFVTEAREARYLVEMTDSTYLQDEGTVIDGIEIWGSPWQPEFFQWAFNLPRGEALREKWAVIPETTRLLVTHGPPHGMRDSVRGIPTGCEELAPVVRGSNISHHVFGHIHEGYGVEESEGTTYVNASICTVTYAPTQAPIVFDID